MATKHKRSYAKGRFTRAVKGFEAFIKEDEADEENLKKYYGDVENSWKIVEERHEDHIATLTTSEEIADEDPWINELHTIFQDIRKRYVKFISDLAVLSEFKSRDKARTIEYDTFLKFSKNLESSITSKFPRETIIREKAILERQFDTVKSKHSELCFKSNESLEKTNTMWLLTLIDQFSKINCLADEYLKTESKPKPSVTPKKEKDKVGNVKMEKMPLPKFTGEPRFYHRFKKDFLDLVRPNLNDREAAFTFRKCLGENVEVILGSGDFTVEQMIERLDEKFGEPSKIIDSIIGDIKKFKVIDLDDSKRLIDLINIIERAFYDLQSLKMEQEISNCNVVSLIESKLPKNVALNWYRFIYMSGSKVDKTNKFPFLLDFLINERKALEYGMSELRVNGEKRYPINLAESGKGPKCIIHDFATSHNTADCRNYNGMSINERYDLLRTKSACFCCLSSGHRSEVCDNKVSCTKCEEYHHVSLHSTPNLPNPLGSPEAASAVRHMDPSETPGNSCIFPLMKVKIGHGPHYGNVLWDSCASICLITNEKAKMLGLKGTPSTLSLTVVGGSEKNINSMKFKVPMFDLKGQKFVIEAYSIDVISQEIKDLDTRVISRCFPELDKTELKRPSGKIDILIGYKYAAWHPVCEKNLGHLLLLSNTFGRCVGGSHPEIVEKTVKSEDISTAVHLVSSNNVLSKFSLIESLGTEFVPKCGKCSCGNCPLGGMNCSIKEQRELALVEKNLHLSENGYWIAGYPWIKNPENLPDNKIYALKLLTQTELRLKRKPDFEKAYCEQISDMIDRGVARKLSEFELMNYKGPVHYIAHHAISKPSSKSTPLRIVFNSSAKYKGHVLNDYWAKGPNVFLNTLLGILIRFRENHVGFVGDIKKMYNSVRIKLLDQHCHRFLWRDMKTDIPPDTYVITRANMGDRPAGTIATSALRKTPTDEDKEQLPIECEIIDKSTFMDDIIDSTDTVDNALKLTSNISTILKRGDFNIKEWIISCNDPYNLKSIVINDDAERVLGMKWVLLGDYFKFTVNLKFLNQRGNCEIDYKKSIENFEQLVPNVITKRMILSQINGIFDPLGLVSPFIIRGKILLRQLWVEKFGWDDHITGKMRDDWIDFFKQMMNLDLIKFKRCVRPVDAVNKPMLVIFSDASREAYGCVGYVRWELKDGSFKSYLLMSKSKVAPMKVITIVRLELLAAVISKRLRATIEKECRFEFERVVHIVDSEIVRAMINRDSYGFNTFTSTRIGEIQEGSLPSDWYWVSGNDNVADIVSRGEYPENLDSNSVWQVGPDFLSTPFADWPIRQDCSSEVLPERAEAIMQVQSVPSKVPNELIDSSRFSSFRKLIHVTARILSLKEKATLSQIARTVDVASYKKGVTFWIKLLQESLHTDLQKGMNGQGKFRKLSPRLRDDGVYVIGGRATKWFEASYNKELIPILPKDNNFVKLYAEMIHNEKHVGVDSDVAKIRLEYWIIGLQKLCSSIKYKCVECRKKYLELSSQVMGPLPEGRLKPSPPWSAIGIDLFGPYDVRGEVNKRSYGKVYGVIFTCLPTTAIYLDIANDYSTNAFLLVFRRFVSLRGYPSIIHSDGGTQMVGASKILRDISKSWNWNQIFEYSRKGGFEWNFSPADAPWYSGCCESLIKSVKKSINFALGEHKVSFSEMQTVVFEAANLVNERPIGVKPGCQNDNSYLSPNDLILGRATKSVPHGPFDCSRNLARRFHFIQELVDVFWKKWTLFYFPSLIVQQKWHHEKRNLEVGDIVIISDKGTRGHWKIGRICGSKPSSDGKVRRVTVQYKNEDSNIFTEIERPVQKLVVILPVDEQS